MLERMRRLSDDIGTLNACMYLASRMLSAMTFGRAKLVRYYVTLQLVPAADVTPPRRGRQILVHEADRAEVLAIPADRPPHVLESRLANGGRCLLACKSDAVVGFQWFTLNDYPEDEVRCIFLLAPEDRCAWDFDIFVFPEWRAQPVFTRLWDSCNRILRECGIRASLSRVNAYNGPSRRAHERLGARAIVSATFLCLGPIQLALFSRPPYVHLSTHSGNAPELEVSRFASESMLIPSTN